MGPGNVVSKNNIVAASLLEPPAIKAVIKAAGNH